MLHFVHGERHKFVEVQILDDAKPEGAERFQLILSEPSPGLELGTNTTGRLAEWKNYIWLKKIIAPWNISFQHLYEMYNLKWTTPGEDLD